MNNKQKKDLYDLYESIMKSVAEIVKKHLNEEDNREIAENYTYNIVTKLSSEKIDESIASEIKQNISGILNSLTTILKPILTKDFENNSDEEIAILNYNSTIKRLQDML